jgi:lactate permease
MFHQLLTPVQGDLGLSFLVAAAPIATVLVLMGVLRRPAWQASLAGLAVGAALAIEIWQLPPDVAGSAVAAGATFALWPIMWIVFNALLLFNIAVSTGRFDAFRGWVMRYLPSDKRIVLVVIGFCFGALLEGVAGFGTPVAITSALLIMTGFEPLEALTYTLIFNTAPVAFGALGAPVTTLAGVTGLHDTVLGAMIGRQLPVFAVLLPFYVVGVYGGLKSIKALWPALLVAGVAFGATQFFTSNYLSYALTDVLASLASLIVTTAFLAIWKPRPDPDFALAPVAPPAAGGERAKSAPLWQGWLPWIIVSAVVIVWTVLKFNLIDQIKVSWPGLDNQVFITLYKKPYAAVWTFQPLATGTAILAAAILTAPLVGCGPKGFFAAAGAAWRQMRLALVTVTAIVALAYLMNYSGMNYTLGLGVASVGAAFPIVSVFLGWVAVFLSGSDTSGNALFGNLQVVAARQLGLSPVLFAAANSSGGVMGKMISPQNISTGVSTTALKGHDGVVLAKTFKHSIILTLLLGLLVAAQQHLAPWVIPG